MSKHLFLACLLGVSLAAPAAMAGIVFSYPEVDFATGDGFDDPTLVTSDITGGQVTLGEERRMSLEAAAAPWEANLDTSTVDIVVEATMSSQGGDMSGAPLGFAGPENAFRDFTGAPQAGTWFPVAQANQLFGSDLDPGGADIQADFNQDVDGPVVLGSVTWYYGTDGNVPPNHIDFFSTAMHELGHGLGFLAFYNKTTGALNGGFPNIYERLIESGGTAFADQSDGDRLTNQVGGAVTWNGAEVNGVAGAAPMYAPNPVEPGSSISHWDTSTTPNELMEPFATEAFTGIGLERQAFADMLWPMIAGEGEGEGEGEGSEGEGEGDPGPPPVQITGSIFAEENEAIALGIKITGITVVDIQWIKDGADLFGEINSTFVIDPVTPADAGDYQVEVTDGSKATFISPVHSLIVVPQGSLPVGGGLLLGLAAGACALSGALVLRRRK